ncbi:putative mitochondrial protein [Tanacetum coccineum]
MASSGLTQLKQHLFRKQAMTEAPVLKLSDFNELFILEIDASYGGIGAVLQQGGHPVAYYSKTLAPRHYTLSTYEKELLDVIQALSKWWGYLLDRHFKIKTYHFSLKYFENQAADALSRIPTSAQLLTMVLSTISSDYVQRIMDYCQADTDLQKLVKDLETNP